MPNSPDLKWYPIQTRYQCEKKLEVALRNEGLESFAPMRRQARQWSDRTRLIESPLFPGYMFVRMQPDAVLLVKVLRLPGLVRFVTMGRDLASIPNSEMEAVRLLAESDRSCEPGPFPALAERIRIRGGCLEGIEGILTGYNDRKEIVISVGAIQRSLKVLLGGYQIELLS